MTNPTDTNQASEDELEPFTSLFQNSAVARDYISGCMSEEDINELSAHIFFIEPTYKYNISKEPFDNIFSTKKNSIYPQLELERRAKEGVLVIHTRGQLKTKFAMELIMDIIERHDEKENL